MNRALTTMTDTRSLLDKMGGEFSKALQNTIPAERFTRIALTAVQRTPALLDTSPESFLGSLMAAAQMGLEPDGIQGALIPYKGNCTFQPMYRGLLNLVWNSGLVSSIAAEVVRDQDEFRVFRGTDQKIEHIPKWPTNEAGDLFAVYAVATMKDGGNVSALLDRAEVYLIRDKSPGATKRGSPWRDDQAEPEMWKKTALKRLCKLLPASPALRQALTMDDAAESGKLQPTPPVTVPDFHVVTPPGDANKAKFFVEQMEAAQSLDALDRCSDEWGQQQWDDEAQKVLADAYHDRAEMFATAEAK